MFSVYCERCGAVRLLDLTDIVFMRNTTAGIVVRYRCHSGHSGVWLTGRRAQKQDRTAQPLAGRENEREPVAQQSSSDGSGMERPVRRWWRAVTHSPHRLSRGVGLRETVRHQR